MSWFNKGEQYVIVGKQYTKVYLDRPSFQGVNLSDISDSLSRLSRFTGNLRRHYSVAEHMVRVSRLVPPELRKIALLHDVPEVVTNDIPTPVKRWLRVYTDSLDLLETHLWLAVATRWQLPITIPEAVHKADKKAGQFEYAVLCHGSEDLAASSVAHNWGLPPEESAKLWLDECKKEGLE